MKQPIPSNSSVSLQPGDRVQIVPAWQDPGHDQFERFVIEVPDDCSRVLIQTHIPEFLTQPVEWIEPDKLVLLPANDQ